MHNVNGLTFVSILDLNMEFWTIKLDKESQKLCGKYSYQCPATGLSMSPDINQEKVPSLSLIWKMSSASSMALP